MLLLVIRAVIFDLDGTLIHSLPGLTSSLNRVLKNAGFPIHSESDVRRFIGSGIYKLVQRATPPECPPNKIQDLVEKMSLDYASTWKEGTAPYPEVTETLQQLTQQNIPFAVCSNKPHEFCQMMTDYLFPDITFTSVIGQRKGAAVKPDPTSAIEIAQSLHLLPENIAFLGDSTIDLITARNAGMIPIAATWGYHDASALDAEKPTHTIHRIQQLLSFIH